MLIPLSCSSTALILSASATRKQYFSGLCSKYDIKSFTPKPLKQSVSVRRLSVLRWLLIRLTTADMASGLASHPRIDRSGKLWKVKQNYYFLAYISSLSTALQLTTEASVGITYQFEKCLVVRTKTANMAFGVATHRAIDRSSAFDSYQ